MSKLFKESELKCNICYQQEIFGRNLCLTCINKIGLQVENNEIKFPEKDDCNIYVVFLDGREIIKTEFIYRNRYQEFFGIDMTLKTSIEELRQFLMEISRLKNDIYLIRGVKYKDIQFITVSDEQDVMDLMYLIKLPYGGYGYIQ